MSDSIDGLPILPHVSAEFYTWLWFTSEVQECVFQLGEEVGQVELWIDERLTFRSPNESKVAAVMTGENPSTTLEARAALAGGKVLNDLRIGMRRDDREFFFTLKGPEMHLQGVKLPQVLNEEVDEMLYDRVFLYEELGHVVSALFKQFAVVRSGSEWRGEVVPAMERWIEGQPL